MGVLVVIWLIVGVVGLIAKSDFLGFVFLLIASGLAFLLFYSGTEGDWIVALVAAGLPFWIVSHGHAREGSWTFFFWLLTAAMLFGTGWTVTGGNGITAAILTAVVIVLSLIIKAVMWKVAGDRRKFKAAAKKTEWKQQQEHQRRQEKARQQELENRYAASPLTWQIICAISDGTDRKPEIIEVYDDHVTGCTDGMTRKFDFYANRVPPLEPVWEVTYDDNYLYKLYLYKLDKDNIFTNERKLHPQMALGAAINRQLGGEYNLIDRGSVFSTTKTDADDELYHKYEYRSDHVRLTLKANNRF
jgi:hypothetical protein